MLRVLRTAAVPASLGERGRGGVEAIWRG